MPRFVVPRLAGCWRKFPSCRGKGPLDQGLEVIAEGLDTLKNMAHDMNEELDRQVPLMDEIDTKLLSRRNFCIDIVLLIIILGIAAYLYNVLKK
ncbi:hypothetical protein RIF29_39982 [Crotalaria pallida]|uniref:t-SNARE coiled-coil homology domain-containing protein n=1 Tax=Crotalaria pallida TaxID=3830 RepID=A0AAN9HR80_CROPI